MSRGRYEQRDVRTCIIFVCRFTYFKHELYLNRKQEEEALMSKHIDLTVLRYGDLEIGTVDRESSV